MTPEYWRRLQKLFFAATELPPAERQTYLESRCGDDRVLLADAVRMLRQDKAALLGPAELADLAEQAFAEERDPYLGRTFGPYHFKSRLAVGGMSWVYLAERPDYGGVVAIKVLRDVMSPTRRQLFDYEKRLLAPMNHPSIARLYDAGTLDDGAAFFVMEYVDGVPITEYCRQHELDLGGRLSLFRQVCEAVRYAHGRGVIHRDLKPSNILVQAGGIVKLLDFGVSGQEGSAGQTTLSTSYMTLAYAAPEQIRHEPAEVQADVYSLGVILQQLLTGRLPFDLDGKTDAELREIVLTQPPARPFAVIRGGEVVSYSATVGTETHPGIPVGTLGRLDAQDLDHICGKALAKRPTGRYQSVESLARELERFQHRQPLEFFHPDLRYVAARFVQRNSRSVLLAAAAIVGMSALIGFYTYRLTQARNAAVAEAARTGRLEKFMERLLTGGDPDNGPPQDLRVVTVLAHGVREAQALDTDPPIQAELYNTLGRLHSVMGDFKTAEPLFRTALTKQASLYGAESPQVADTLASLGIMQLKQGRPEEAEVTAKKALTIDRQRLPVGHSQTNEAGIDLGLILIDRGAYKDAVQLLQQAAAQEAGKNGSPYALSTALSNLAIARFYMGDLSEAESLDRRALAIDRQSKGDENIDVAEDLMSLAAIDERLSRRSQAEAEERQALLIEQHWYGEQDQPAIAGAMTILAQTLTKEDRYAEALPLAVKALAMRNRLHEAPSAGLAHSWNTVGQIQERLGHLDEAEQAQSQALAMYKKLLPDPSYQAGVCLDHLAAIHLARRQYVQADAFSLEALRMLQAKLPADDPMIAAAEVHFGSSLTAERRLDAAEAQFLAANAIFLRHTEGHEEQIRNLRVLLSALYREKSQPEKAGLYEH